jgi:hypothetical protein
MPTTARLFISHSAKDGDLAELVTTLLTFALKLPAGAIRCTSVDGHRLPGGAHAEQQLRREIQECDAFIGILSARSMQSQYVLIELGARWVLGRPLIPLLAPRTPYTVIGGPLVNYNALRADSAAELHQMVEEVASVLGTRPDTVASYQRHVEAIVAFRAAEVDDAAPTGSAPANAAPRSPRRLSSEERDAVAPLGDAARELLLEAVNGKNGDIMVLETLQGLVVEANGRQFVEQGSARSEAKWRSAVQELFDNGCLDDAGGKREMFLVTDRGFRVADVLEAIGK